MKKLIVATVVVSFLCACGGSGGGGGSTAPIGQPAATPSSINISEPRDDGGLRVDTASTLSADLDPDSIFNVVNGVQGLQDFQLVFDPDADTFEIRASVNINQSIDDGGPLIVLDTYQNSENDIELLDIFEGVETYRVGEVVDGGEYGIIELAPGVVSGVYRLLSKAPGFEDRNVSQTIAFAEITEEANENLTGSASYFGVIPIVLSETLVSQVGANSHTSLDGYATVDLVHVFGGANAGTRRSEVVFFDLDDDELGSISADGVPGLGTTYQTNFEEGSGGIEFNGRDYALEGTLSGQLAGGDVEYGTSRLSVSGRNFTGSLSTGNSGSERLSIIGAGIIVQD